MRHASVVRRLQASGTTVYCADEDGDDMVMYEHIPTVRCPLCSPSHPELPLMLGFHDPL